MANNAAAVRVGGGGPNASGAIAVAPVGSTGPTDSTSALDAAFKTLGLVSEDGVTESYSDDTTEVRAWQGGTVVRTIISGSSATLHFTLLETRGEVLKAYHKGSTVAVTGAGGWKVDVKAASADPRAWVIDVVDGTKHIRLYAPNAEVSERGDIVYSGGDPIGYELTITCYPDANSVLLTKLADDPNWGYS